MRRYNSMLIGLIPLILLCSSPVVSSIPGDGAAKKLLKETTESHGGAKALSCNSITLDFDVAFVDPKRFEGTGRIVTKPDRFRLEYNLNPGLQYRYGYDGAQAWAIGYPDTSKTIQLDMVQATLFKFYGLVFSTRWLQYLHAQGSNLKYGGQESYGGVQTEILQANVDVLGNVDFLIEMKTHLLKAVRFNFPGEWQPHYEIIYGSYVDHNGINIPKQIDIFRDKKHYRDYKIKEVHLCEEIANSVFAPSLQ